MYLGAFATPMIKRTIEISSGPTYLSVKDEQLVVRQAAKDPPVSEDRNDYPPESPLVKGGRVVGTIPCEDIGVVIVDHPAVTYTHGVLTALAKHGAVAVVCGADHHPAALLTPIEGNALHTERLRWQVELSRPLGKRIWQQIVRAKILAQAGNLAEGQPARKKLLHLADDVKSGDPSNVEAQAAKVYWGVVFEGRLAEKANPPPSPLGKGGGHRVASAPRSDRPVASSPGSEGAARFRRDVEGVPPNNLLNYGYMAIRAATARAISGAGLHPSIGFHHRNRYNPFCLADDLVEPLRPLVDRRVRGLHVAGKAELDKEVKAELLGVLTERVTTGGEEGPLLVGLGRYLASLVKVMEGGEKRLEIPTACM